MYTILCDNYPIFDPRVDELTLINPNVKLEVNKVGEASFLIYKNHPHYNTLFPLKSLITIKEENEIIFRGRITNDTTNFDGGKTVDVEGVLAYLNDTNIPPYEFPGDFIGDANYEAASTTGNVVEFFLRMLINKHNEQVKEFQQFKIGKVTVKDNNNYIIRSDSEYKRTWEIIKTKLFESSLGGYLCIRYEEDGNYIDYLSEFEFTNTQPIEFGENLLDIQEESNAIQTYSAIIPFGAVLEDDDGKRLTIEEYPHEEVMVEYKRKGNILYNQEAVEQYGWIYAPVSETTWDDIHEINNLVNHGVIYLWEHLNKTVDTIDISAVDLHFTDKEIQGLRIYRNVKVKSLPHNHDDVYPLTKLDIDLLNPQNTKITVGKNSMSLIDYNIRDNIETEYKAATAEKIATESKSEITTVKNQIVEESTKIISTCNEIILSALENYVETSNYTEFKETVETQLKILSDQILLNFTTTTEEINNVDGDLQSKFTELYKYISFSSDGIVIGDGETGLTLSIDNDMISFKKGGQQFGWWDGTDFHTGNIVIDVDEKAQFGNFAYIPRSDGSLMFLKVR